MRKIVFIMILLITLNLFAVEENIFSTANKYRDNGNYQQELSELKRLNTQNESNVEISWRIAQSHFDIADQSTDKKIHKAHFYPGLEAAKKALVLDANSSKANHWYATLIGKIGIMEGTKQKILNSYEVREFGLKAISIDPNYDGTLHLMGRWHYELASLSWAERKIAGLIYSAPPKASFIEATDYFIKASEAKSDEIRHQLWLGKTYIKMKETSKAENAFGTVAGMNALDKSDAKMKIEAAKLLKKL